MKTQYRKLTGPKHVLAGGRKVQVGALLNSEPLHVATEVVEIVVVEVALCRLLEFPG